MSRLHLNHSNFRAETVLRTAPSKYPPPYVLKRAEGYFAATILKVALPLLLILLLAGCPHNNSIETRTLSYDANLPEGHSLSSGTLPGTKVYMKGAKVVVAAAGELITTEGDVGSGWNTMPDGSGDNYFEGQTITLDSNITLYATYGATQRILNSAEAAQLINELQPDESVDILITDKVDFDSLRIALSSTKGKVELDLVEAENLTSITANAFQGATGVFSVTLPNTVTSIESNAFAGSGLKSLILEEGKADSITKIDESAIPDEAKIYVPDAQLSEYKSKFPTLSDKIVSDIVTITVEYTGAGTSTLQTEFKGAIGTRPKFSEIPQAPSNFTFVKWVDDSGKTLILPIFKPDLPTVKANATFVNAAGYPVYPAYLTVQRTSYAEAENDDVGQEKPTWAGGDKTYSTQITDRPMTHTPYDAFTFDGTSQQPTKGQLVVTTGNTTGIGSFRIPALNKLVKPDGTTRLFAAADIRYRGRAEGNGDCGDTTAGGSDFLVAYSDDGGATWTKKAIDVPNVFNEEGQSTSPTYGHDLGDPQLWTVGNTIYVGGVTGTGILKRSGNMNSGFRVFKSVDYGENWTEDTDISQGRNTYAFLWNNNDSTLVKAEQNGYANLPCPGHGIVLTKDVPGTDMKKGMTVVPMQGGSSSFATYLIYGFGEPSSWDKTGTATIPNSSQGEWQVCQLDDGTLFVVGKKYFNQQTTISSARYTSDGWTEISSDPWIPRGASQSSVIKIADGNLTDKYGVVAFTSPKSAGAKSGADNNDDKGRDKVTISFGRDITGHQVIDNQSPIDSSERYYIQIRKMGHRFFGYSDMVMVDREVLGVIYECSDNANNDIDGLRFMTIDVSEVVKKLSVKN